MPNPLPALALLLVPALVGGLWAGAARAQESSPAQEPKARFSGQIEVEPVVYTALAVDRRGRVITDLAPSDLEVSLGGRPIPVRAVEWRPSLRDGARPSHPEAGPSGRGPPGTASSVAAPLHQRMILVFVQSAFEPSRTVGHRRTRPKLERLLEALADDDLVALVSFDSRPRLRLDATTDRPALRRALDRSTLGFGGPPAGPPEGEEREKGTREPSLFRHLDRDRFHDTFQVESALEQAARALGAIDREPLLVFVGWGLGRLSRTGLHLSPALERATEALVQARVPVFVLDVTDADAHSLDMGLQDVADRTGGTFRRTNRFPERAIEQVGQLLSGRHVLVLDAQAHGESREAAPDAPLRARLARPGELLAVRPQG